MRSTRHLWTSKGASYPHRSPLYSLLKYALDTDACAYQVGCALLQEQASVERLPIVYCSCALTDGEKTYTITAKECLAVMWSILTIRPYLFGNTFDPRTDHEALRWNHCRCQSAERKDLHGTDHGIDPDGFSWRRREWCGYHW